MNNFWTNTVLEVLIYVTSCIICFLAVQIQLVRKPAILGLASNVLFGAYWIELLSIKVTEITTGLKVKTAPDMLASINRWAILSACLLYLAALAWIFIIAVCWQLSSQNARYKGENTLK